MRFIIALFLSFGIVTAVHAQKNDIISTSINGFHFYDEPGFVYDMTTSISFGLAYEHIIDDKYGVELKAGFHRLDYWNHTREEQRYNRSLYTTSLKGKRYFDLFGTEELRLFTAAQLMYRDGGSNYIGGGDVIFNDLGIGVGGGIQGRFFNNSLILQAELMHTSFLHNDANIKPNEDYGDSNPGSEHQLNISFSMGIAF